MSNTIVRSILADQLEISADSKGNCSISIRGAAEILGVPKSSLFDRLKALRSAVRVFGGLNAETVVGEDLSLSQKISDTDLALLLNWYATEAPRGRTNEAKELAKLVLTIGIRGWMQAEAGHEGSVQELVQSVKIDRLEIDAEVDRLLLERISAMDEARAIQIAKIHSDAEERIQLNIAESAKHTIEYQDVQLERLYRENLRLKATLNERYALGFPEALSDARLWELWKNTETYLEEHGSYGRKINWRNL